jgi:hypothetical protein
VIVIENELLPCEAVFSVKVVSLYRWQIGLSVGEMILGIAKKSIK